MNKIIFVVEEAPEGGYTARALGVSIFTEADGLAELEIHIRDAVVCHFEEPERPRIVRLHFVREEVIAVWLPRDISGEEFARALHLLAYQVTRHTGRVGTLAARDERHIRDLKAGRPLGHAALVDSSRVALAGGSQISAL